MQGSKSSFFNKISKAPRDSDNPSRGGGDSKKTLNHHKQERKNGNNHKLKRCNNADDYGAFI